MQDLTPSFRLDPVFARPDPVFVMSRIARGFPPARRAARPISMGQYQGPLVSAAWRRFIRGDERAERRVVNPQDPGFYIEVGRVQ